VDRPTLCRTVLRLRLALCHKGAYQLEKADKLLLAALLNCTALFAIFRQLTLPDWSPGEFLGQRLPVWEPLPEPFLACSMVAVKAITSILLLRIFCLTLKRKTLPPLPAVLVLVTTVAIFTSNQAMSSILWIFAPPFFHASQYLALTAHHYLTGQSRATGEKISRDKLLQHLMDYFARILLIACGLFVVFPFLLQAAGLNFQLVYADIFCIAAFHHFCTDMFIWKLRQAKLRDELSTNL
jgi:hypothetical protein